jgi:hypothetical protein
VGPELVPDAVTAHGWLRDVDQPGTGAMDPTFVIASPDFRRPARDQLHPASRVSRA